MLLKRSQWIEWDCEGRQAWAPQGGVKVRIEEDCWRVRLGCRGCQHEQHICDIDVSVGEVRVEELHLNSARSLLLCDLQSVRKSHWELTAQQT